MALVNCQICGAEFNRLKFQRFCSPECQLKFYIQRNDGITSCQTCGVELSQEKIRHQSKTCSKECSLIYQKQNMIKIYGCDNPMKNPEIQAKAQATNLIKYGGKSPAASKEVIEKMKQTNLERYGETNAMKNPEILAKVQATNEERYGHKCSLQSEQSKEKIRKTYEERYEGGHPARDPKVQAKRQATCQERYNVNSTLELQKTRQACIEKLGVPFAFQSAEFREQQRLKNLETLGVENVSQSPKIQAKIKETNMKRFGRTSPFHKHFSNYENYNREFILKTFANSDGIITLEARGKIKEYFNIQVSEVGVGQLLKRNFDLEIESASNVSFAELKLRKRLEELFPNETVIYGDRNIIISEATGFPLELDFYYPDLAVAIEYNGTYFHESYDYFEGLTKEEYKTKACADKGITLFHIWDTDDIEEKLQEIVEFITKS